MRSEGREAAPRETFPEGEGGKTEKSPRWVNRLIRGHRYAEKGDTLKWRKGREDREASSPDGEAAGSAKGMPYVLAGAVLSRRA